MDPNEALKYIRAKAAQYLDGGNINVDSFVEHVAALDEWLSKGGFLPEAWDGRPACKED